MAEGQILLTADEMQTQAGQADNAVESLNTAVTTIQNVQSALEGAWKGQAASAFQSVIPEKIRQIQDTIDLIQNVGDTLRKNADDLTTADSTAAQAWN